MTSSAMIAFLLSNPDIARQVGNRAYPHGRLAQKATGQITETMPALTVMPMFASSHKTTSEKTCYEQWRVQINCWGRRADEAQNLRQTVATLLDGYRGDIGGTLCGLSERNSEPPLFYDDDKNLWLGVTDFTLHTMN
jgi:hypothetical protein